MGLIILTLLGLKYLPGWVKLVWLFHPSTDWAQTSMTYVIMTNCKNIYRYARAHKFFGISSPEMMDEIERDGLDQNPPGGDE